METKDVLIACDGLMVEGIVVPPFVLHKGQTLHLQFLTVESHTLLGEHLAGVVPHPAVRIYAKPTLVKLVQEVSSDSIKQYLQRFLSPAEAVHEIEEAGLCEDITLSRAGYTEKMLLALTVALEQAPVVIYESAADPRGNLRIRQYIARHLADHGIIELHGCHANPENNWHGPDAIELKGLGPRPPHDSLEMQKHFRLPWRVRMNRILHLLKIPWRFQYWK